jgi:hypothetical protein
MYVRLDSSASRCGTGGTGSVREPGQQVNKGELRTAKTEAR